MSDMKRVVIVGGAAMGWATAHHLLRLDPEIHVTVVEKDPSLRYASTTLSDGNVRIQFNLEENVAISMYAMETLESFERDLAIGDYVPDPRMRKQGNLFLVDDSARADALAGLETQQRLGANSTWLDMPAIASRYPALESPDLVGGTFGPDDGSVDPNVVVDAYRRHAVKGGADTVESSVETIDVDGERATGVRLVDGTTLTADCVVVCAGAWSAGLLATAGVDIPVDPVMRTVYIVSSDIPGTEAMPSVFLPSGVYVLPEHDRFLIAWSTDADPVGFDFTPAPRSHFYDMVWPGLVETLPKFDRLEVTGSWAGLYAQNRLDANGIIGEWPSVGGLYLATGFSGHGFQQCHAVGRYLGELITATTPTLDLSRLGPERILAGEPVREHAGRII